MDRQTRILHDSRGWPIYLDVDRPQDVSANGSETPQKVIVIAHGFRADKDSGYLPYISQKFLEAGFAVARFTFPYTGVAPGGELEAPERFSQATASGSINVVKQVLNVLADDVFGKEVTMGVLAISLGAPITLVALKEWMQADERQSVHGLCMWAPAESLTQHLSPDMIGAWREAGAIPVPHQRSKEPLLVDIGYLDDLKEHESRLDAMAALKALDVPFRVIHGEADETTPIETGRRLVGVSQENGDLIAIPGADHRFGVGMTYEEPTDLLNQAVQASVEFFTTHLSHEAPS